ncbi:MAG: hypothetical protein K9M44_02195 [Candidatus Pacebacteria bacterium]|nr:hypothetical protein [Candidatus Paceibacterota bacterium]
MKQGKVLSTDIDQNALLDVLFKLAKAGLTKDLIAKINSDGDNRTAVKMVQSIEEPGVSKWMEFEIKPLKEANEIDIRAIQVAHPTLKINWSAFYEMIEFFAEPRRAVIYSILQFLNYEKLQDIIEAKGGVFGNLLGLKMLEAQHGKKLPANLWLLSPAEAKNLHTYGNETTFFYLLTNNIKQASYVPADKESYFNDHFSFLFFY